MGKREIVGVPNRILWDTGTELFKTKKPEQKGPLPIIVCGVKTKKTTH
jgi:hypothetical protein